MSWRLRIRHITGFTYAGTAHASYNEARMTPLTLPQQTTLHSVVDIQPAATSWRYTDYWGTVVTVFDLQRGHDQLRVAATSLVETGLGTPSTVEGSWGLLRSPDKRDMHAELLAATPLTKVSAELVGEAASVVDGADPAEAAVALADWVRAHVAYVPGSTGVRTNAQEAWALRKGVCQDIAQLTVGLLRAVGIPARYVSGYLYPKGDAEVGDTVEGQSHAWVEYWVGGWAGYDPTNGTPVGHRHVLLARGRDYADVTPLKGAYNGAPSSHIGVTVEITRLA
jgi:transglutaminase-like putative cysteine protease